MRKVELIQSKLINITIPDKPSHFAPSSQVNSNKAGKQSPSPRSDLVLSLCALRDASVKTTEQRSPLGNIFNLTVRKV